MMRRFVHKINGWCGFTLIEVILVVVIAGILSTVALRSGGMIADTARIEETKQELNALAFAIVGNPELENNGVRSDFGYVGDIGALPPDLDALVQNPGGYSTWNGPYIKQRFSQITDDHKIDAFGREYSYEAGVTITSLGTTTGGGGCGGPVTTGEIVKKLANTVSDLTVNQVSGNVYDLDGSPPGVDYKDSVMVRLTIPNGSGATQTRTITPGKDGYFAFDTVPVGVHDVEIIYTPNNDTLRRFITVLPDSRPHTEYRLNSNIPIP